MLNVSRLRAQKVPERLQEGDDIDGTHGRTEEEVEEELKRQEAKTRARTLEIVRDGPWPHPTGCKLCGRLTNVAVRVLAPPRSWVTCPTPTSPRRRTCCSYAS